MSFSIAVREAYVPDLAAARIRSAHSMTRVGQAPAAATAVTTNAATATTVDLQQLGLYVGLPAVGGVGGALLAGLGATWAVILGVIGAAGGYFYLDYEEEAKKKQAAENAAAAAAAADKTRIANLDIDVVATQTDAIGVAVKAGLALFTVGFVPGGTGKDYTLATFAATPTDAMVKQLTDLQKMLIDAGYAHAGQQVALAASTAAKLRDAAKPLSSGEGASLASAIPPV